MYEYEKDGAAIYRQSFATIRAEADLSLLPADVAQVAVRMIHACGQVDLVRDIAFSPAVVQRADDVVVLGQPAAGDPGGDHLRVAEHGRSGVQGLARPADVAQVAVRMIHACGQVDLVADLAFSPAVVERAREALHAGAPVLCDAKMVAAPAAIAVRYAL